MRLEKVIKSIVNIFLRWALFLHLLLAISSWEKRSESCWSWVRAQMVSLQAYWQRALSRPWLIACHAKGEYDHNKGKKE
jgi:hypothetical protein